MPVILVFGVMIAAVQGRFPSGELLLEITKPVRVTSEFSLRTPIGVAPALSIVTMASQNLPVVQLFWKKGTQNQ